MIYYLTAARNTSAMGDFLATLGRPLATRIRILPYEQLFAKRPLTLPQATYIFTSIGLPLGSFDPPAPSRQLVAQLRQELIQRYGPGCVLNDPINSLRRHALLRTLHERGINQFAAYHADELPDTARFPLFLRYEAGAQWSKIPLFQNRQEFDHALAGIEQRSGLLAVEFCDTADETGFHRKYGAFVLGDRIVPRHLYFSRHWMVKEADVTGPAQIAEEMDYVEHNPHAETLLKICRIARIEYGRIDYAIHAGRLQVWEINTTPSLVNSPGPHNAVRSRVHDCFLAAFSAAVDDLERRAAASH